jgi:hypothetical protein
MITQECPFARGWMEYTKRIGSFSSMHYDVAEYYNSNVKPGAINTCCIIHQTFRAAASERIKVGGKRIKYAQIAAVWSDGVKMIAPDEWLPVLLEKAKITRTELNMILRNNADIFVLYLE